MTRSGMQLGILLAGVLVLAPAVASDRDGDSMYGTHRIAYERVQSHGFDGCLLRFLAVRAEDVTRDAKMVAIEGHIVAIRTQRGVPMLGLKIALKDVAPNAARMRPQSAHLRTTHWSTENRGIGSGELQDDFALFVASLRDRSNAKLLHEMVEEAKVVIVFRRTAATPQVLVPLDLTVANAEPIPGGTYRRERSAVPLEQFRACLREIL